MKRVSQRVLAAVAAIASATAECPNRTVLTTDCSSQCPESVVCIKYSRDFAVNATMTSDLKRDASGCVFRCLGSSIDENSKVFSVRVPYSDTPNGRVEDIAALTLPANTTGLDLTVESVGAEAFGFPGHNIVANGSNLHFLGLRNLAPNSLPAAVYDLPIATLRLQLGVSDIPASVVRFKTINTLILNSCTLVNFPVLQVIASMPQVRNLSLSDNIITKIEVDNNTQPLYSSSGLLTLQLAKNQLTTFDASFSSLISLDLQDNQLRSFPSSIAKLQVLKELRLDGNPLNATQVAAQLGKTRPLSAVQVLSLSRCGFQGTLPAAFASTFANLSRLDLSENSIESIASQDLPEQSLEELFLASNALFNFSGSFVRLKVLDVSRNALRSLPARLPVTVTTLNASTNALTYFDVTDLPNLESLDLSWNKLTAFPAVVWNATKLSVLRLQGNINMAPINVTLDQVEMLKNLRELKVDETTFSTFNQVSTAMEIEQV